jgi:hypothetical protein
VQHTGVGTVGRGVLGDQLFREMVVEVGDEHSLIMPERNRFTTEARRSRRIAGVRMNHRDTEARRRNRPLAVGFWPETLFNNHSSSSRPDGQRLPRCLCVSVVIPS